MELPDPSLTFISLVLATVILAVIVVYRHFTNLRRCGFPGPTPLPFFGNFLTSNSAEYEETLELWMKQYGNVYGYYLGHRPNLFVAEPEMLKTILVKEFPSFTDRVQFGNIPKLVRDSVFFMDRQRWKKTRTALSPLFSGGKLRQMAPLINKCAETLSDNLKEYIGETVILKKLFESYSMDAITTTAFGINTNCQRQKNEPFVTNITKVLNFSPSLMLRIQQIVEALVPGSGSLLYKFGLTWWNKEAIDFYERTGKNLIEDRIKNNIDRVDFLHLMINGKSDGTRDSQAQHGAPARENRLTLDEMNGTVFIFFLAGYDTTATLLYYASYCLAVHPDIDRKIAEEIDHSIGQNEPSYDSVGDLKYTEQFLNEVLRFYPPIPRFDRLAARDVQIGDRVIPKGTVVNIPAWYIHHSGQFYSDPETFDPSRFKSKGLADSVTFLPFGFGPRHCIGMRLAMLEAKLALVYILRKVRFVRTDKTEVPLQLSHYERVQPKRPIQIRVEKRQT